MGRRKTVTTSTEASVPSKPKDLGQHGSKFWDETVEHLRERGTIQKADRRCIELASRAYEEYRTCEAVLRKLGRSYGSKTDRSEAVMVRPRPEATQADAAWKRVMSGLQQLGLTPATRSRVSGSRAAHRDDFEEYLHG